MVFLVSSSNLRGVGLRVAAGLPFFLCETGGVGSSSTSTDISETDPDSTDSDLCFGLVRPDLDFVFDGVLSPIVTGSTS